MSLIHKAKGSLITNVSLLVMFFRLHLCQATVAVQPWVLLKRGYSQVQNGFPCYGI